MMRDPVRHAVLESVRGAVEIAADVAPNEPDEMIPFNKYEPEVEAITASQFFVKVKTPSGIRRYFKVQITETL